MLPFLITIDYMIIAFPTFICKILYNSKKHNIKGGITMDTSWVKRAMENLFKKE